MLIGCMRHAEEGVHPWITEFADTGSVDTGLYFILLVVSHVGHIHFFKRKGDLNK